MVSGSDLLVANVAVVDYDIRILTLGRVKLNLVFGELYHVSNIGAICIPKAPADIIQKVLEEYVEVFWEKDGTLPAANLSEFEIQTTSDPTRQRLYRLPLTKIDELERQVNDLLTQGSIEPSSSSPITLVSEQRWYDALLCRLPQT